MCKCFEEFQKDLDLLEQMTFSKRSVTVSLTLGVTALKWVTTVKADILDISTRIP